MDILLIVVCMFFGSAAGAGIGLAIPGASPENIALLVSVGGFLGALFGFLLLALWKKTFDRSARTTRIGRTPRCYGQSPTFVSCPIRAVRW